MMAKYFATSLAIENVVRAPRVMSSCLPISTTSINLVGSLSKSTMLPASLAACVPEFMAMPTSACASAGASFVPSPIMATSLPSACSLRMYASLASGVASATKVVDTRLRGNRGRGQRIVAGDHHRSQAHFAQAFKSLGNAGLENVFQHDQAGDAISFAHQQRRGPFRPRWRPRYSVSPGTEPFCFLTCSKNRIGRTFADFSTVGQINAAHSWFVR